MICLTGRMRRRSHLVIIDEQEYLLTFRAFKYLIRLAAIRINGIDNGWVLRHNLGYGDADIARSYLHELRAQLRASGWKVYECDNFKRVRLFAELREIILDVTIGWLLEQPDEEIRQAVRMMKHYNPFGENNE